MSATVGFAVNITTGIVEGAAAVKVTLTDHMRVEWCMSTDEARALARKLVEAAEESDTDAEAGAAAGAGSPS